MEPHLDSSWLGGPVSKRRGHELADCSKTLGGMRIKSVALPLRFSLNDIKALLVGFGDGYYSTCT